MNTEISVLNLAKGLQQSAASSAEESVAFLNFAKGDWTWGTEDNEPEVDSLWAIHPQGFQHGWIAWGDKGHENEGKKLSEILVPATNTPPSGADLVPVEGKWTRQVAMQLVCVSGIDKGVRVMFNGSSLGIRKLYKKIVNEIVAKINAEEPGVAPVVSLGVDSYKHPNKTYGKIYEPLMHIKKWFSMSDLSAALAESEADDDEADDDQVALEAAAAEEAEKAEKAEKAVKAEAKQKELALEGDKTDEAKPTTRRRRRTVRA